MFFTTIKAIHFLALVLGAGASLGNIYLMLARGPHDLPAPELTKALRKWYRLSALVAILTLWVTGVLMASSGDGWIASNAFNAKLVFATALLAIIRLPQRDGRIMGPAGRPARLGSVAACCRHGLPHRRGDLRSLRLQLAGAEAHAAQIDAILVAPGVSDGPQELHCAVAPDMAVQ